MGKTKPNPLRRRTRLLSETESSTERFMQSCKCVMHSVFKISESMKLMKTSNKNISVKVKWLISQKFLSPRAKYVCVDCLDRAPSTSRSVPPQEQSNSEEASCESDIEDSGHRGQQTDAETSNTTALVDEIITLINNGQLSPEDINKLCFSLGKFLEGDVLADLKKTLGCYKQLDNLLKLDSVKFLQERTSGLVSFLSGVTNLTIADEENKKKRNAMCLVMEDIYCLRNNNYVGPFSFSQALVKWSITGSRTTHTLDGASSASGSITSLKKVLSNSSSNPNVCFPSGDVDVFADNTQRIGKTGRVRIGGTTPAGVVTNVVFLQKRPVSNIESRDEFKPSRWLDKHENVSGSISELEKTLNDEVFRPHRHSCLSHIINQVHKEIRVDEITGELKDHVFYSSPAQPQDCVCPKCCKVYNKSKMVCTGCGHNSNNLPDRQSLYGNVPSCHPPEKPLIKMGEIIPINPNSKQTIKEVLLNIKEQSGVGQNRSWVRVGFDGVPYRIADLLIQNLWMCDICKEEYDISKTSFDAHCAVKHPGVENATQKKVLDDILLTPGAGHIELNILRPFFSLTRFVFMEHIAGCLGFRSKRAKEFIIRGSNHHVTWQIFDIVYKAFSQELCYVYLSECMKDNTQFEPSAQDFVNWKNTRVVNPNYNMMYDLVFHTFLGLQCFRSGIRRNNSRYALAGRQKAAPVMYIGRHAIYQRLLYRDMQVRVEAPKDVKEYIEKTESFSRSGDPSRGEGGDYVTEGENRSLKSNLPPGVPTVQNWIMSSRCSSLLQDNRKAVFNRAGIQDPGEREGSLFNREFEVQAIRKEIRMSGMLSEPYADKPLKSIDGKLLYPDFVNFYHTALANYSAYKASTTAADLKPVFVTFEDESSYNDTKNWTIKKIKEETLKLLDLLQDQDSANLFKELYTSDIVNGRKITQIEFYQDIKLELDREREAYAGLNEEDETDELGDQL